MSPASSAVAAGAPRVELRGISRAFGATVANQDVDLSLEPASIHALVGENGAGKSTLMRVLYGLVAPDRGEILINGRPRRIRSPADALALGIGMMHQHFMLVPPMTVLENVVLGYPGWRGLRRLPRARLGAEVADLLARYGFDLPLAAPVSQLGVGERQRVEIARLLFHGARLLICDEPTAVLAPPEVDALLAVLERLREEGRTIVLITHKLAEVLSAADRVTVLRRGRVVGGAERGAFDREQLVAWIMGEGQGAAPLAAEPEAPVAGEVRGARPSDAHKAEVALRAEALAADDRQGRRRLQAASFVLQRGEILGVAGVQGNGQRELVEAVAGRRPLAAGCLQIGTRRFGPGQPVPDRDCPALIPEDRLQEGLFPRFRLWENLLVGHLGEPGRPWRHFYRPDAVRAWATELLHRFRVAPPEAQLRPQALSGGNQQKLLCARALSRRTPVLVAAQPTRGIDLASTRFLHQLLRAHRDAGGSVLLVSADLDEILALSDRVAVLYRGRLTSPRPRVAVDLEHLGRAMVGLSSGDEVA